MSATLEALAADVELRTEFAVNVEALAAVEPDLILHAAFEGTLFGDVPYEQVSAVAPTVAAEFVSDSHWRDYFLFFADALGKRQHAEDRLAALDARIAALADALPAATTVSVVNVAVGSLGIVRSDISFIDNILTDLGVDGPRAPEGAFMGDLSLENLDDADADAIYVVLFDADAEGAFADLEASPLWQTLGAVRAGRVYPVGPHWYGFGPTSANEVLDDLERTLLA